ncbi:MAG TPA: glutamate-5-semialdehyde dehydrogenase [Clostridia bacterium]|nr:glutamate-5-semialdehyde dehydrogenase [Clostridia bacterium]
MKEMLTKMGEMAKRAEKVLACSSGEAKNKALQTVAEALIENSELIIEKNKIDLENAKQNGLPKAMLDRLSLNEDRVKGMADGIIEIVAAEDPVGKVKSGSIRPNGLRIEKITVPLGVIAVIFEARPNVTADAAALCLKAGNVVILRGGKEAINSNMVIAETMRNAIEKAGLPKDCIQLVSDTSRESANMLMKMNDYVDVLIPRGGAGLIKACVENSTVPVIETGSGNCHIYVDATADIDMATDIVFNAKTSRPSVCNACESLLLHKDIAEMALLAIKAKLDEENVEIRGDESVCAILPDALKADDSDWDREYLDYTIAVKTVNNIDEAIEHISEHGTGHSECIITSDYTAAQCFLMRIDAAAVYVNASTRFTDGGVFGYGAEIGISTQKLHARGPLGLDSLTSEKYIVYGSGQVRQ